MKGGITRYPILSEFRDSIFMEIALLVGILHISLSLLRQVRRSYGGAGWIFAIFGGYLFFPKMLGATTLIHIMNIMPKDTAFEVGQQLMWGGMGCAIILALIQHKWGGFIGR